MGVSFFVSRLRGSAAARLVSESKDEGEERELRLKRSWFLEVVAVVVLVGFVAVAVLAVGAALYPRSAPLEVVLDIPCGSSYTVNMRDLDVTEGETRISQQCSIDVYFRGGADERGHHWYKFKFTGYGDEQYLEVADGNETVKESRVILADRWIGVAWLNPDKKQVTIAIDFIFKEKKAV